jgi:hypothetical protein
MWRKKKKKDKEIGTPPVEDSHSRAEGTFAFRCRREKHERNDASDERIPSELTLARRS